MGIFDTEKIHEITDAFSNDLGGSGTEKRPLGRARYIPEVRNKDGEIVVQSESYTVSRVQHAAEWIGYCFRNRPSTLEIGTRVMMASPYIILGGGIAVAALDSSFDLSIAKDMANVKVDNDANFILQIGQTIVHETGEFASGK